MLLINTIGSIDDLIENLEKRKYKIEFIFKKSLLIYTNKIPISDYKIKPLKSGIKKFTGRKTYLDTSAVNGLNNICNGIKIAYSERPSRANMEPLENTIWFAKMKNTQKFLLVSKLDSDLIKSNIFSTGFLGFCNSDNLPLSFLLAIIISEDFNVQKNAKSSGTTMEAINNKIFESLLVPKLSNNELKCYKNQYENFVYELSYIRQKIDKLKKIKQFLLLKYFN
ncbi:restriction endonuclease subunit S [Metamycoplasma hominis]|uniref:restriction endonuclease subunit S n=1 Tax=Metamycoplasma hominis TaxID=2098 RepID=UPI00397D084E